MPFSEILDLALKYAAALGVTATVLGSLLVWLFRAVVNRWLDTRFQTEMEKFKATNVREVERLKADLARYADRATKFHVKEYEVLPEAWGLMNKAYGAVAEAVAVGAMVPRLDELTEDRLEAWLDTAGLSEYEVQEIRSATSKQKKFEEIRLWRNLGRAEQAVNEFKNYVILQGVFIPEGIVEPMVESSMIMNASISHRISFERRRAASNPVGPDSWDVANDVLKAVDENLQSIKKEIRARLTDIQAPSP